MIFKETDLPGSYIIELDKKGDDRGFFARFFCKQEMAEQGLNNEVVQINNSLSQKKGTLRGFHYQLSPYAEDKIVRCINGSLYDVIIDLRKDSETFGKWFGEELSAENRKMMYVPKGFAHGLITLEPDTEIFYMVTQYYAPEYERGIRWNDPMFNVQWPIEPVEISDKDKNHRDFDPEYHLK